MDNAIAATTNEALNTDFADGPTENKLETIKNEYLELLLKSDTKAALQKINTTAKSGVSFENIYIDVLQETMEDVGNMWHKNQITVDKEHYCTTTTQMAMSQFYTEIFSKPRNGYKLLSCCVGSELHEMGIRMVSDLFELNGWDSIYLGAAVPKEALLHAIEENKPDLVALSVTMPLHLPICYEMVNAIREKYKDIKLAVGGRAFVSTLQLWKKWNVDVFTENAVQLVEWAEKNIVKEGNLN